MRHSSAMVANEAQADLFNSEQRQDEGSHSTPFRAFQHDSNYAQAAKIAGRLNASKASAKEHDTLLAERQSLLDKKFEGTITRKETIRLEYVRWSLDRIEDAKHGEALDVMESHVAQFEQFRTYIERLEQQLSEATRRR
jgi:hypothetical protein